MAGHDDSNDRIAAMTRLDTGVLPLDGGPDFNRLIFSTSPYLLQHADNPVDWYPWGDEAFLRAADEQKPVLLSIGYSTCHWCHVMAHESFEDPEVAEVLNRLFVCVKVDREERPDIDEQYMAVAQMMTGSGGWPLTIFMTPEKKPFYATTYIPRHPQTGMPGILQILDYFDRIWRSDRKQLEDNAGSALGALQRLFTPEAGALPDRKLLDEARRQLAGIYDPRSGGFGSAPKFPMPLFLDFLLRYGRNGTYPKAAEMVGKTLRMMRQGGIYDQIGFGFHRYSVDSRWLVPHFEKMLYDQALVSLVYLESFQETCDPLFQQVAEEIFSYVSDRLTAPEGGFYAGEDADSEGEEGRYYLWTPDEILEALGDREGGVFCRLFGVSDAGNYEGRNILHLPVSLPEFCAAEGVDCERLAADCGSWRKKILGVRGGRIGPFRDEKVITAWNGLMITSLARGYAVSGNAAHLTAARRATEFILSRLTDPSGRLMRSFHRGRCSEPGFLEDYACFTGALIELHQVTLEERYLEKACFFAREMLRLFSGSGGNSGALHETGIDAEQLLVRHISAHDGVVPSGNSMAAFDFLRLGRITGDDSMSKQGEAILRAFMGTVSGRPTQSVNFLSAFLYSVSPEVMVTLSGGREELGGMIRALQRRFIPHLVLRYGGGVGGDYPAVDGRPTAYLCAGGACRPPVSDLGELSLLLDTVA